MRLLRVSACDVDISRGHIFIVEEVVYTCFPRVKAVEHLFKRILFGRSGLLHHLLANGVLRHLLLVLAEHHDHSHDKGDKGSHGTEQLSELLAGHFTYEHHEEHHHHEQHGGRQVLAHYEGSYRQRNQQHILYGALVGPRRRLHGAYYLRRGKYYSPLGKLGRLELYAKKLYPPLRTVGASPTKNTTMSRMNDMKSANGVTSLK